MTTFTGLQIITSAYRRLNRLSPGEPLSAEDAAFGFDTLNELVDELAAQNLCLFQSVLTSGVVSGATITLGTGAWSAITVGDDIVSGTADNLAMDPITMQQYNEIYQPAVTGRPTCWAPDGLATVYFYPVPTGHTIKLQTRATVSRFADQSTPYTAPDGWQAALAASLAVRLAPTLIGTTPADLLRAENRCMGAVSRYKPKILNSDTFNKQRAYFPPRLF